VSRGEGGAAQIGRPAGAYRAESEQGVGAETMTTNNTFPAGRSYLDVARLSDGRYCVQFVKDGVPPRTSYTSHAAAVVRQAQSAGNIPVRTVDAELRRACSDQRVELIS
jgi:hypothetical protein